MCDTAHSSPTNEDEPSDCHVSHQKSPKFYQKTPDDLLVWHVSFVSFITDEWWWTFSLLRFYSKESYILSKEPYFNSKEPYFHSKEPYFHSKEPWWLIGVTRIIHIIYHWWMMMKFLTVIFLFERVLHSIKRALLSFIRAPAFYQGKPVPDMSNFRSAIYSVERALHSDKRALLSVKKAIQSIKSGLYLTCWIFW